MGLQKYHEKRKFNVTPEPRGRAVKNKDSKAGGLKFFIQEHHASHLHYDFRLEMEGVLRSWAVPKGPSTDPTVKRLAVEVEDHPMEYGSFEGVIPENQYGAGHVILWDHGTWVPGGDAVKLFKKGRIDFELKGKKLHGRWLLVRTSRRTGTKNQWLLMKRTADVANRVEEEKETDVLSKREPLPRKLEPQLARLVEHTPLGPEWSHEMKLDGYRVMARIEGKKVRLLTRSGLDWTEKFETIRAAVVKLGLKNTILDGEIVVFDEEGRSSFQALQNALSENHQERLRYCVFDAPFINGNNVMEWPLTKRREHLKSLLKGSAKLIRYSASIEGEGRDFFKESCRLGLEGVISKRIDAPYESGRGDTWVKSKCVNRQEFVVVGFTDSIRPGDVFASLLLAVNEKAGLRYVGKTGTGFTAASMRDILKKLRRLEQKKSPLPLPPREKGVHWVRPQLVAEVNFATWTSSGHLRQASFQGLRADKKAALVIKEVPKKINAVENPVELTHPDKIIFKTAKLTKQDLADYYAKIERWILPHVANRPLTIVRCPGGAGGKCFYRRHVDVTTPLITETVIGRAHGGDIDRKYISIDSLAGLQLLVQLGTIELHAWNTNIKDPKHPRELIFDLDPGPGITRRQIYDCAIRLKKMLEKLSLKSFVNLSGSKGLHIHVPIAPIYSWEAVKEFSHSVVRMMMEHDPDLYTDNVRKIERKDRIFIDYLRNGFTSTSVIPYSVRNNSKATVAIPISWRELKPNFEPAGFDIEKTIRRLSRLKKDPWAEMRHLEQKIEVLGNSGTRPRSKKAGSV